MQLFKGKLHGGNKVVILIAQGVADIFELSEGCRPIAMATGFLRQYQSMIQVRHQVCVEIVRSASDLHTHIHVAETMTTCTCTPALHVPFSHCQVVLWCCVSSCFPPSVISSVLLALCLGIYTVSVIHLILLLP